MHPTSNYFMVIQCLQLSKQTNGNPSSRSYRSMLFSTRKIFFHWASILLWNMCAERLKTDIFFLLLQFALNSLSAKMHVSAEARLSGCVCVCVCVSVKKKKLDVGYFIFSKNKCVTFYINLKIFPRHSFHWRKTANSFCPCFSMSLSIWCLCIWNACEAHTIFWCKTFDAIVKNDMKRKIIRKIHSRTSWDKVKYSYKKGEHVYCSF